MDESNTLVGEFMCQGKMQQAVRDRYVKMKAQPDAADLENLRQEILK
ncbi:flavodoxin family protein [Mogibacterium kristiansenii]